MKQGRARHLKKYQRDPFLDEREFKTDLESRNTIFVGSATDIFGEWIPSEWIERILSRCREFDNVYVFQSKNPGRFKEFTDKFPARTILGTTIETDEYPRDNVSKAQNPKRRAISMIDLSLSQLFKGQMMISIEPIIDFDPVELLQILRNIQPNFVSVGADSKNCNLPEPSAEKVVNLLLELRKFSGVKLKSNLKRLGGDVS